MTRRCGGRAWPSMVLGRCLARLVDRRFVACHMPLELCFALQQHSDVLACTRRIVVVLQ